MLQEREAWMERRNTFSTLYVSRTPGAPLQMSVDAPGVATVGPGYPLGGFGFDLIVVPVHVQREHKRWLEDTLLTRLKPNGKLIIVNDP